MIKRRDNYSDRRKFTAIHNYMKQIQKKNPLVLYSSVKLFSGGIFFLNCVQCPGFVYSRSNITLGFSNVDSITVYNKKKK